MKTKIIILSIILLSGCSSTEKRYEKAIVDAVQTTSNGIVLNLDFKVEKLQELKKITVADSIEIINNEFKILKEERIDNNKKILAIFEEKLDKQKKSRIKSPSMVDLYQKTIDEVKHRIDSIQNAVSPELIKYENSNSNEVLAILVKCSFKIKDPVSKTEYMDTYDFTLSPDGKKCMGKTKSKSE